MKKIAIMLALALLSSFATTYAEEGLPEGLIKLNKNAEKPFHYKKGYGKRSIILEKGLTKPYTGDRREAVEKFLKEYHKLLFLSEDLSEIKYEEGMFVYGQYFKGVPVERGGVSIDMDREKRIYGVSVGLVEIEDSFNVEPAIKLGKLKSVLQNTAPDFTIEENAIPKHPGPVLVIRQIKDKLVLVYKLWAYKGKPHMYNGRLVGHPFVLIVDASTGKVLEAYDMVTYG